MTSKSLSRYRMHCNSHVAEDKDLYSSSKEERESVCFLDSPNNNSIDLSEEKYP